MNLYNGGLDFVHTDFELKGNSHLSVGVGRRFVAGGFRPSGSRHFGAWDLDIPKMHGVFSSGKGWQAEDGTNFRCSRFSPPAAAPGIQLSGFFEATEFWQGTFLYVPGVGDQQVLQRASNNVLEPTSQSGVIKSTAVTKNFWSFTCTTSLANPSTHFA